MTHPLPAAFTITMRAPVHESFALDASDNEWLWLPTLGPTGFVLLRVVQHDFAAASGGQLIYRKAALAERVGTAPSRLASTIERLQRFRFIEWPTADAITMFEGMRKPNSSELHRLPASVLAGYRADRQRLDKATA